MWGFGNEVPKQLAPKSVEQLEKEAREAQANEDRRGQIAVDVAAAILDLPKDIDLPTELLKVRKQLETTENDEERQRLHVRFAALTEFEKSLHGGVVRSETSIKALEGIPHLATVVDEILRPDFKEAENIRVQKIDEPEMPKVKKVKDVSNPSAASLEGTGKRIVRPASSEDNSFEHAAK